MPVIRQLYEMGSGALGTESWDRGQVPVVPLTLFKPKKSRVAFCAPMSFLQEVLLLDHLCV